MKLIIVVALALVAVAVAAPAAEEPVKILRSENEQQPDGSYVFSFETEDGVKRQENGEIKQALDEDNKPHDVVVVRGQYEFVHPDGQHELITYYADESGFHAEGDSIPKVPAQ